MNDMDTLLGASAPRTSGHDPQVRRAISELSDAAAQRASRGGAASARRRVAAVTFVASVGLGSVGAAAAVTSGWWGGQGDPELLIHGVDAGLTDDCMAGFRVAPDGEEAEPGTIAAARVALQQIDPADLDLVAAEQELIRTGRLYGDEPEAQRASKIRVFAVYDRIEAELREQGFELPGEGWGLLGGTECSGEGQ